MVDRNVALGPDGATPIRECQETEGGLSDQGAVVPAGATVDSMQIHQNAGFGVTVEGSGGEMQKMSFFQRFRHDWKHEERTAW